MSDQAGMLWHERLAIVLYVAIIALLPFGRLSEIPVLLLAVWGLMVLVKNHHRLWREPHLRAFTMFFAGMMTLTVVASVDSLWPAKSWLITLGQLRFYLAGMVLLCHPRAALLLRQIATFVVLVLLFWCFDATIQALWGHNLLGIEPYPGRLTGLFGANVKLGPVLALFLPLILVWVSQLNSWLRWILVIWVLAIIILSGTRSAWLMAAFVLGIYWWHHVQGRRLLLLVKTILLSGVGAVLLWHLSVDFQQRVSRSMQLLEGDRQAIDFALADRLPIWDTAVNMYLAHPVNGVGPRAFRKAYQEYAAADDVWLASAGKALHAHHWVLEIMAETGTIGLLIMGWLIFRQTQTHWRRFRDPVIWPYGVALLAALLPVVSLYSLFSSFWSICLWWMLMMLNSGVKNE